MRALVGNIEKYGVCVTLIRDNTDAMWWIEERDKSLTVDGIKSMLGIKRMTKEEFERIKAKWFQF